MSMIPSDPIAIVSEAPSQSLAQEIAELRELKASMAASRVAFFTRLRACEERGGWRSLAPTFALFLKKTDLCTREEYAEACRTIEGLPTETIDTIGIPAASKVVILPEESRPAAIDDLKKETARLGPLSKDRATAVVRKYMPPPRSEESRPAPRHEPLPPARTTARPIEAPPEEIVLRLSSREPSAIAAALIQRLGEDECRALILALDAKVNRVRAAR